MHFDSKVYDALKKVAQVWLPAAGTLYFALAGIWHLPNADEVVGSVVAVDTFLGVLLGVSSASYAKSDDKFDGTINVNDTDPTKTTFAMDLTTHPDDYMDKGQVLFKVQQATPEPPAPNLTDPRLIQP